jgi:hypothetical protein
MAIKSRSFVTSSEEGRGAYGIVVDNDEQVYFPMSFSEKLCLEEFEELEAIMIRNDRPEPA